MNNLDIFYYCWIVAFIIVQIFGIRYNRKIDLISLEHLEAGLKAEFMEYRELSRNWSLVLTFHMMIFILGCAVQIWYEHWWLGL